MMVMMMASGGCFRNWNGCAPDSHEGEKGTTRIAIITLNWRHHIVIPGRTIDCSVLVVAAIVFTRCDDVFGWWHFWDTSEFSTLRWCVLCARLNTCIYNYANMRLCVHKFGLFSS